MKAPHHQREKYLNVKDIKPQFVSNRKLPPVQAYNPKVRDGSRSQPSRFVTDLVPDGKLLVKNISLSSEFSPTFVRKILPNQRMRWKFNREWGGRFPGVFQDKNVTFEGHSCVLRATKLDKPPKEMYTWFEKDVVDKRRKEGKPFFGGSFLRTAKTMTFGYTEIGCKLADSAVSCAFWLKELGGTKREIDVFEYTTGERDNKDKKGTRPQSRENIHLMTIHKFEEDLPGGHVDLNTSVKFDKDLSKEMFFKAGLLWTPRKIYWFVNDVVVRELEHNGLFGGDCKMHVQVDREIFDWIREPDEDDKLEDFRVFYIRTWDL